TVLVGPLFSSLLKMKQKTILLPSNLTDYSFSDFRGARIEQELAPDEVLRCVQVRLEHVVDECPQRSCIFEIDSDVSEDALVKVVQKLSSKFAQIDVITHDDELHHLVLRRLQTDLKTTTVETKRSTVAGTATTITGTWRTDDTYNRHKKSPNEYSLTLGTLGHFMRAEFELDVKKEREEEEPFEGFAEKEPTRVVVLYRTDTMLDGKGILEAHDVDTVELQVTPLLCHIYRLVDLLDEPNLLGRLREFIKRYPDRFVSRFLDEHLPKLIASAKAAKKMVRGAHFGCVWENGTTSIVVPSSLKREHLAIHQFLQVHHSLSVSPLRVPSLQHSPLHLLKTYDRIYGVFRRGGYELREWLPFLTQLKVYPSRVYPHDHPVTPIFSITPAVTISEWIVNVEKLMGFERRISQSGMRLIVCPSASALRQLFLYLKYSHSELVSLTRVWICTGSSDDLERLAFDRPSEMLTTVLTTAPHFETWHTRYLCKMEAVTVYLGTPSKEVRFLHRAYRFARPVKNVVTVPLELSADQPPNDSGFDSDKSNEEGESEEQKLQKKMVAEALHKEPNRSYWARVFMTEMWGKADWMAPLSCPEDKVYEACVEWTRQQWRAE
ncbi:hypothetical protein PMAYCL1PPCAC_04163, partial [Pristionchus mayeri]